MCVSVNSVKKKKRIIDLQYKMFDSPLWQWEQ